MTAEGAQVAALPPLSLYIHIPWCVRKCPYCDFNSHEATTLPEADYVEALLQDLASQRDWLQGRALRSIFFGGGTPSLFSGAAIARILDGVAAQCTLDTDIEITLEANPGTAEQGRFRDYHHAGVNRLSIGVQSFHDTQLKALGRIHDAEEARRAVDALRRAGFERFNLDLMHGLPGQTPAQALADIEQALALGASHLSWYQLTIEPNTAFHKRPPTLPQDDQLGEILDLGLARLAAAGLHRYEVSAHAHPGEEARHNLNYWRFGDYLGIGAGAHGKVTLPAAGRDTSVVLLRYQATRMPRDYLAAVAGAAPASPIWPGRNIAPEERPLEFMMNALRLREGFAIADFEASTGLPWARINTTVDALIARGLLLWRGNRVTTTATGFDFLDSVVAAFLPGDGN